MYHCGCGSVTGRGYTVTDTGGFLWMWSHLLPIRKMKFLHSCPRLSISILRRWEKEKVKGFDNLFCKPKWFFCSHILSHIQPSQALFRQIPSPNNPQQAPEEKGLRLYAPATTDPFCVCHVCHFWAWFRRISPLSHFHSLTVTEWRVNIQMCVIHSPPF